MSVVAGQRANGAGTAALERRGAKGPASKVPAIEAEAIPPVEFDHEELVIRRGARSGLNVIVAIHSTVLGPALGGVRLWCYENELHGARDALRLAQGMTYKAAAAGLDLGGGKGVIVAPSASPLDPATRREALQDFGDLVESLGGRYVTAEDVGISPPDLVAIRERTRHVTGLPPEHGGSGDPSPFTALGVESAMRACAASAFDTAELRDRRVAIAGLGHVGAKLARRLAAAGAELVVSDIDPSKRRLAEDLDADWVEPEELLVAECDVVAPCALGGAIDSGNVGELRCAVVCGSANNILAEDGLAGKLAARGILYAPDFIANAGGLISVYSELHDLDRRRTERLTEGIGDSLHSILEAAESRGITPLAAAYEIARERLERARRDPGPAKLAS
jgi:leucine dehydrogenase